MLFVTDIYPAGEAPIPGATGERLSLLARSPARYDPDTGTPRITAAPASAIGVVVVGPK